MKTEEASLSKTKSYTNEKTPAANFSKNLCVVGIGTSAGGLEALITFFKQTKPSNNLSYVIVQHLDRERKSLLTEILAKYTKIKITEITDKTIIKPNCIYIIPSNKELKIKNKRLLLSDLIKTQISKKTIDTFFYSLANDLKDKAIGVILSGHGRDGSSGLKKIKSNGGITFVQESTSAKFNEMPINAISTKAIDYILPVEKIPYQIANCTKKINSGSNKLVMLENEPTENEIENIFNIIRNQTGYDFSKYKTNTISRRILKRCYLNNLRTINEYILFLKNNPNEVENLYQNFLIGVTNFFRDVYVFNSIEKKVIPYLIKKKKENKNLRIWICGCSTGQEAYSIAILLKEALLKKKQDYKVTIFASDLDKTAIEFARAGVYSQNLIENIPPAILSKYFIKNENKYQIKKEIREMIVFSHHNAIKDPPFSKMDMISCRNLLIYMNSELQKRIIPLFHYSLNKEGMLILGTSESVGDYSNYFTVFDSKAKIYISKPEIIKRKISSNYELPNIAPEILNPNVNKQMSTKKNLNLSNLSQKILLDNYAPPYVIIDESNNALYFSGKTSKFIEPPHGTANLNILEMAKKEIKIDLETAIKMARNKKSKLHTVKSKIKIDNQNHLVNLIIKPILSNETELGTLMVIFENFEIENSSVNETNSKIITGKKTKITEIEQELKITREHLETAINELEYSNKFLQSTNEKYQFTNEELQSTNEELETSREELQSVNEELITSNTELTSKNEQLSQANNDLNNLLSSIEIATIFLDKKLNIKRFTQAATKIFNIIPSDIDRPLTHLSSNIIYEKIEEDIKNTIKTLAVKITKVKAHDGTWYRMSILPYRTAENIIDGVLLTFVDITEQNNSEEKLEKTNDQLNLIIEHSAYVSYICELNPKFRISFISKNSKKTTGFLPENFTDKSSFFLNRIHSSDKTKMNDVFKNNSKKRNVTINFRWKCADGKYKYFKNYIHFSESVNNKNPYIIGILQELNNPVEK